MANFVLTNSMSIAIDDSGGTPITIGGVTDFDRQPGEANTIDVTTLGSVDYKEYCFGLLEPGTITINYNWYPTDLGQLELLIAAEAQATRTLTITFSDSNTIGQECLVLKPDSHNVTSGEIIKCSATIQLTGAPTRSY